MANFTAVTRSGVLWWPDEVRRFRLWTCWPTPAKSQLVPLRRSDYGDILNYRCAVTLMRHNDRSRLGRRTSNEDYGELLDRGERDAHLREVADVAARQPDRTVEPGSAFSRFRTRR